MSIPLYMGGRFQVESILATRGGLITRRSFRQYITKHGVLHQAAVGLKSPNL